MKPLHSVIGLALVFLLLLWRPWQEPSGQAPAEPVPVRESTAEDSPAVTSVDPPLPLPVPHPDPVGLSPSEIQRIRDAIDNLELVFRDHAVALGGNPVGTNAEITAALRGDNAKQLRLEIPGGSTVNADGELCDPWGTPWFFHQLSRTKMEIRSAGKDRRLYTEDDFVR